MVEVSVESSGDRVVHTGVRLTEDVNASSIEAVDIVLGKVPDPGPNQAGVEELAEALVGRPLGALEEELRELSSGEEPHLP